jgi:pyruvate dehydrogenase E2 component (dihydrolipoamide acetyltransferase)
MAKEVLVPDVGDAKDVEVVEILVSVGDVVDVDDSLVVLESDKASMEIPSPWEGKVESVAVKVGDQVDEGDVILAIAQADAGGKDRAGAKAAAEEKEQPAATLDTPNEQPAEVADSSPQAREGESVEVTVVVPDVGDAKDIVVAEIIVTAGDAVAADQSLVVLESDKASMEIPSPQDGVVREILVSEGDEVEEGDALVRLQAQAESGKQGAEPASGRTPEAPQEAAGEVQPAESARASKQVETEAATPSEKVYAGPAVRKQAREYGVDLADVAGSGRKGRILKEDVQGYVKHKLGSGGAQASAIPPMPTVDFAKFGEIELKALSRVRRASARNLHRSWLNVPHVTQFDEADITDLEAFRKSQNEELSSDGIKLTPLAFLLKACVNALIKYPQFNSSIDENYDNLIVKKYYNIGVAVETDDGLMVPVLKDADKKGIIELANDSASLARMAREKKLPLDAMQGATFSISSLGGIGGTAFTPIVNAPEVAILGVSRSKIMPVFDGKEFKPRTMLPLSLSYDHRAIDGAEAVRFTRYLSEVLSDVRRLLL